LASGRLVPSLNSEFDVHIDAAAAQHGVRGSWSAPSSRSSPGSTAWRSPPRGPAG
jgi:hypothetical protein